MCWLVKRFRKELTYSKKRDKGLASFFIEMAFPFIRKIFLPRHQNIPLEIVRFMGKQKEHLTYHIKNDIINWKLNRNYYYLKIKQ
jgi:hypothetical protein